jgi:hypothetical protein
MFKATLVGLSLAGLLSAGVALAADAVKVEPGTGPTETMTKAVPVMTPPATGAAATGTAAVNCTQAELTTMTTKAGALTDKNKQKMIMGHLDLAKKSMNQKDMDGCTMHMKEAAAGLDTVTK